MRRIKIERLTPESVNATANGLSLALSNREDCEILLPPGPYCPNRIVPLMALADVFAHKGLSVHVEGLSIDSPALLDGRAVNPLGRIWRFSDCREQYRVVEAIELALMRIPALGAGFRVSFSWCLNEVMDNVLNHSAPLPCGKATGYVMVQYAAEECRLKVCVFDFGIGLLRSFDASESYNPKSSPEAIALAVKENVTSGKGQGNGLWGLHELVRQSSDGRLMIKSGDGEYLYAPVRQPESSRFCASFPGYEGTTLVDFQFVCHDPLSIDDVFPSTCGTADNWLENNEIGDDTVLLKVRDVSAGTGSRGSGLELRTMVENIIDQDRHKVVLDFDGVTTCSSSFVDELIGKLVLKYGFFAYSQLIGVVNASGISERLINHSMAQRMALKDRVYENETGASGCSCPECEDSDSSSPSFLADDVGGIPPPIEGAVK